MTARRQPWLGLVATAGVIVVSLAFIALFDWPTFRDQVSFFLICTIPFAFVVGAFWGGEHPRPMRALAQPWQGLALLGVTVTVGGVVAAVMVATVGGGVTPPTPMVAQCVIISVPIAFFLVVVWGGWPFTLIRRPVLGGTALLVVAYVLTAAVFRLFDYTFLKGAPVYLDRLDPKGPFDAWAALAFVVTCMAAALLVAHFELWPITLIPAASKQPVLGLCWTAVAVAVSAVVTGLGLRVAGTAAPQLLAAVTVPFLFGSIVMLNMLEGSLFRGLRQPVRGLASALLAMAVGAALARFYLALAGTVTGTVVAGPPAFDAEVWLASALLGVTFPFLAYHADLFGLWPLRRRPAVDDRTAPERSAD